MEFTEATQGLVITNIVIIAGALIKMGYDMWSRVQDRKDREQLAQLTELQLEAIKKAGGDREKKLVKEIVDTKQVVIAGIKATKEFAKVANGVNEKIASMGLELKDKVQDVHVVNSEKEPVPVDPVKD